MKRSTMSILALAGALALGGLACDDDGGGNNDAAVKMDGSGLTGGSTAGAGGSKTDGSAGTGGSAAGSGGSVGDGGAGTGGSKADGSVDGSTADGGTRHNHDGGGDAGTPAWATTCLPTGMVAPGAIDFCDYYDQTCGNFYGAGQMKFSNRSECETKYAGYNATQKSCVAYHLCAAGASEGAANTHCPHPAGGGGNPCGVP